MTFREGELHVDFTGCIRAERFDKNPLSGPKAVDLIVEETDKTLLVEAKDPCYSSSQQHTGYHKWVKNFNSGHLINRELVPKCRDSCLFLRKSKRDKNPFYFIAVLGVECLSAIDNALLLTQQDKLRSQIYQASNKSWNKQIKECSLLSVPQWHTHLPYRLSRQTVTSKNS